MTPESLKKMPRKTTRIMKFIVVVAFVSASFAGVCAAAQDIKVNVTYICNGARLVIDNCNMRDTSDTSTCMVGHPDTVLANGLMKYTYETRGNLKKLLPTCKQPTAQELAREEAFQKKQQEIYSANEVKANPQPTAQNQQAASASQGMNPSQIAPPTAEERAMRRCVSSGRLVATCTGNGLLGAFTNMISQVLPGADKKNEQPGPNMAGVFQGAGSQRLDFIDEGVLVNCADLSPNQESYSLDLKNGHATLTINTTPRPLVLAVHGDGTINGPPGPVTINGVIAGGSSGGGGTPGHTETTATTKYYQNQNDGTVDSHTTSETTYVPGTYTAPQTTFVPRRTTCPSINLTSKGAGVGVQTMETDLLKSMVGGDKGPPTSRQGFACMASTQRPPVSACSSFRSQLDSPDADPTRPAPFPTRSWWVGAAQW